MWISEAISLYTKEDIPRLFGVLIVRTTGIYFENNPFTFCSRNQIENRFRLRLVPVARKWVTGTEQ